MKHDEDYALPAPLAAAGIPAWLVRVLAPRARRDEIVGDLVELWHAERRSSGAHAAGRAVWRELLRSAPSLLALRWHLARPARRADVTPMPPPRALEDAEAARAFAVFLSSARRRPHARWPLAFAVGCHGALVAAAMLWSAWQTEELTPPPVLLTMPSFAGAPAPGAAPGAAEGRAAGASSAPSRAASRARPARKPRQIAVAPAATPEIAPASPEIASATDAASGNAEPDGDATAVAHAGPGGDGVGPVGSTGSCAGGSCVGSGGGGGSVLGPSVAAMQCLDCPPPALPPAFAQVAGRQQLFAKICVSAAGEVSSVKVVSGIDASVDAGVIDKVRTWRYRPYSVSGRAVPFCYMLRFAFEVH